jgi:simple sugar transport system ATP-binding protein
VQDLDLDVNSGEILGVAGVAGNGQEELARLLARLVSPDSGLIEPSEQSAAYIPEDRGKEALALGASVADNAIAREYRRLSSGPLGWLSDSRVGPFVESILGRFGVQTPTANAPAESLSGGNQQRLVLGRELEGRPDLIVAHNPSRGLDVRSSRDLWSRLVEARNDGAAVVVISPDLAELIEYSDRIVVMYQGRIVGAASPDDVTVEQIGSMMVKGIARDD